MFDNRQEAGRQLVEKLELLTFEQPIVLGIPNGGIPTAIAIAREMDFDFDVVFSRKIRHPFDKKIAMGALSEDFEVFLHDHIRVKSCSERMIEEEVVRQKSKLLRQKHLIRGILPEQNVEGRSVIITDDGVSTGSTILKAIQFVKLLNPKEIIVAVPTLPRDVLDIINRVSDRVVCLDAPLDFWSIEQLYSEYDKVNNREMLSHIKSYLEDRESYSGTYQLLTNEPILLF